MQIYIQNFVEHVAKRATILPLEITSKVRHFEKESGSSAHEDNSKKNNSVKTVINT